MGNSTSSRARRTDAMRGSVVAVAATLPQYSRGRRLSIDARTAPAPQPPPAAARTPLVHRSVQASHVLKKTRSKAALGLSVHSRPANDGTGGYTHVVSTCKEGQLGWASGLREGTLITAVNNAPCDGLGHRQIVGLLVECNLKGTLTVGSTTATTAANAAPSLAGSGSGSGSAQVTIVCEVVRASTARGVRGAAQQRPCSLCVSST